MQKVAASLAVSPNVNGSSSSNFFRSSENTDEHGKWMRPLPQGRPRYLKGPAPDTPPYSRFSKAITRAPCEENSPNRISFASPRTQPLPYKPRKKIERESTCVQVCHPATQDINRRQILDTIRLTRTVSRNPLRTGPGLVSVSPLGSGSAGAATRTCVMKFEDVHRNTTTRSSPIPTR